MMIDRINVASDVTSATFFTRDSSVGVDPDIVHRSSAPKSGSISRAVSIIIVV
jgi:hypothetical protein